MRHSAFVEQSLQERIALALLDLGSKIGPKHLAKNALSVDLTMRNSEIL